MPIFTKPIPLSLYVHIPWCVRKCPYCDFNSHEFKESIPEAAYIEALLDDLDQHVELIKDRCLKSIFFGGGTPSLFSPQGIEKLLQAFRQKLSFRPYTEITLEANPGTIDYERFQGFRQAGVNRLSLGIQSLQDDKLSTLGRIHNRDNALQAIEMVRTAGFDNFNLDLMFGLPNQTIDDALADLATAINFNPPHLSWYQLTIEPNTFFYHQTPILPVDDTIWEMQVEGQSLLANLGYQQYEVSAYSQLDAHCLHNLNYWQFGDYLGIGAGAHSKLTNRETQEVTRFAKVKNPKDFLDATKRKQFDVSIIKDNDLIFEFMLNALRLNGGVPVELFTDRTGLAYQQIEGTLKLAISRGLLIEDAKNIRPSKMGEQFLNDLTSLFLKNC